MEQRLATVLATGDFHYVLAAQRFTDSVRSSQEYLNATMTFGRFYLLEVVRLDGAGLSAYAAQVAARPSRKSQLTGTSTKANETELLSRLAPDSYREAVAEIFQACPSLGITFGWGSKGTSLRVATPDRTEPLSIGWVFAPGDQWSGATHVTLGVDENSLESTPSVQQSVHDYVRRVSAIEGAMPASGKYLNAYTFAPAIVPIVKDELIDAVSSLISRIAAGTTP